MLHEALSNINEAVCRETLVNLQSPPGVVDDEGVR
jgi:hypothetical protein